MEALKEFLTKALFDLGGFTVYVWHLACVIAALLIVALIITVGVAASGKRKKSVKEKASSKKESTEESDLTAPESDDTEKAPINENGGESEESKEVNVDENAEEDEVSEPADVPLKSEKPRRKVYHISLRDDGLWQVKLGKGERALKLFATQAEAITFAKQKAKSQDGSIIIHKVDGKIRKQHYDD